MTVIVTGATSFIGRAVVKALLEEGCRVVAVSRPASAGAGKLQELFEDLKQQAGAENKVFVNWEKLKNWKKFTKKKNCRQRHGFI